MGVIYAAKMIIGSRSPQIVCHKECGLVHKVCPPNPSANSQSYQRLGENSRSQTHTLQSASCSSAAAAHVPAEMRP